MPSKFIKFNINQNVKVKLTEEGKKILAIYHHGDVPDWYSEYYVDSNGWWTFQCHTLMRIFGNSLFIGNHKPPFETDILIKIDTK